MGPVCPKCLKHPCGCDSDWQPPSEPFAFDRLYATALLVEFNAVMYDGSAHLVVPATRPGWADLVYEFDLEASGQWRCQSVGRREHTAFDRKSLDAIPVCDLWQMA